MRRRAWRHGRRAGWTATAGLAAALAGGQAAAQTSADSGAPTAPLALTGERPGPAATGGQDDPRPVTLQQAIDLALLRNPQLAQARNNVDLAEYDRLGTYGNFLPNLNMGYGFSNSSTGRLDPTGQAITRTSYTLQLSSGYDIFTGLRRFNDLKASRLTVNARSASYRQAEYQTVLQVKQAYFNAVATRELVGVERDRVRRQEDQLSFVRQQVELGRATRSDLLRSQVDLNNARLALLNAENDARAATFQLAEVVGVEERVAPVAEATLEGSVEGLDRDRLMQAALQAAPSVVSAEASKEAAVAGIDAARSSYLPNLRFSGGWAWQNDDFPPSNRSWSLSLSGSYPLFNGFQRETQLFRAQTQADNAQAQERAAKLAIRADVDEAYSQIQAAEAGIELAEQSVELSRESLRVVQERYRLGLATILDLQQAQITLSQAEVDLVNRRFDYQLGLAQLESLLGAQLRDGSGTP